MLIRKATGEEMLNLWGYESAKSASPTARFFYRNISAGNAIFWTWDTGADLIGELYVFLDLEDKDFANGTSTGYLCAFRIKKEYRGQGLGSRLMERALADLKEKGFRRATIGVNRDETQNLRLYRRLGFTSKVKDCFYDPCGMDENMQPEYDENGWLLLSKEL